MKPRPFLSRKPKGLAALEKGITLGGTRYVTRDELADATGLTTNTLEKYLYRKPPLMPQPEPQIKGPHGQNLWRADRQDVIDFITRKSRPGRGYRTDVYGPKKGTR